MTSNARMIVGSGYKTIAWGFILLLAGIPVYVWMKWQSGEHVAEAPKVRRIHHLRKSA